MGICSVGYSDSDNNLAMCSVCYSDSENNMGILFSWLQCIDFDNNMGIYSVGYSDSDNNMGMCSVGYSVLTLITIWEYVQLVTV